MDLGPAAGTAVQPGEDRVDEVLDLGHPQPAHPALSGRLPPQLHAQRVARHEDPLLLELPQARGLGPAVDLAELLVQAVVRHAVLRGPLRDPLRRELRPLARAAASAEPDDAGPELLETDQPVQRAGHGPVEPRVGGHLHVRAHLDAPTPHRPPGDHGFQYGLQPLGLALAAAADAGQPPPRLEAQRAPVKHHVVHLWARDPVLVQQLRAHRAPILVHLVAQLVRLVFASAPCHLLEERPVQNVGDGEL
mmetsp:Transcript_30569/g.87320  ORF Transcript_30569/g.87320 Transcript_30569/m.87320 type:complete len:249 (+) Transcript_30569:1773-2519(+)